MGVRNYLIDGVSGTGKTSVCRELRRGHQAINGDAELAYQGDPETGLPVDGHTHENHIWDVEKVKTLVAGNETASTFFCGGSRNFSHFVNRFDGVFSRCRDRRHRARRPGRRRDPASYSARPS